MGDENRELLKQKQTTEELRISQVQQEQQEQQESIL